MQACYLLLKHSFLVGQQASSFFGHLPILF
jgi:hypothetical protein